MGTGFDVPIYSVDNSLRLSGLTGRTPPYLSLIRLTFIIPLGWLSEREGSL